MKFCGKIGFLKKLVEVRPGIWKPIFEEKEYVGDVLKNYRRFQDSGFQNEEIVSSNRISIISDLYLQQNWLSIRYVIWNGAKIRVADVDISQYPRAILNLGGAYNGNVNQETGRTT